MPALAGVARGPQQPGFGGLPEYHPDLARVAVVDATGGDHDTVAGLLEDLRGWGYADGRARGRVDPSLAARDPLARRLTTARAPRLARHSARPPCGSWPTITRRRPVILVAASAEPVPPCRYRRGGD